MNLCAVFCSSARRPLALQPQDRCMSLAASTRARDEISSWPGYEQTPLHSLSALARQLGLAALWYKDESQRFGVGSFKAIGGGYAVCEILKIEVQRQCGHPVTSSDLRS